MGQIKDILKGLAGFEGAFTDVRIVVGEVIKIKTPVGWAAIAEAGDETEVVKAQDIEDLLASIDDNAQSELREFGQVDRAIPLDERFRVRINVFQMGAGSGTGMLARFQPTTPRPFDKSGLPIQLKTAVTAKSGLILVCGRTGAGKTSTLATLIDLINSESYAHVVTIEEPIEYIFRPDRATFTQREVGADVRSFASGVHAAMRQAPDVILIGEIRDRDTAEAALRAALSGHLVLATTHGDRAYSAIERLFSYFPNEHGFVSLALRSSLIASVAQVIMPSIDNTGYVVAAETLNGSAEAVQRAIADPATLKGLEGPLLAAQIPGSNHFNLHLRQHVSKGRVSPARAAALSPARKEFVQQLKDDGIAITDI